MVIAMNFSVSNIKSLGLISNTEEGVPGKKIIRNCWIRCKNDLTFALVINTFL